MAQRGSLAGLSGWGVAGLLALITLGQCVGADNHPVTPTASSTPLATRFVTPRSLNCRSEPSQSASPVRSLTRGDSITVAEEKEGWVRVDSVDPCWVSAAFLSDRQPSDSSVGTVAGAAAAGGGSLASSSWSGTSNQTAGGSVVRQSFYSTGSASSSRSGYSSKKRSKKARGSQAGRKARYYDPGSGCPCSGSRVCIGPRGGRYCITSGGNKRYGV